MKWLRRRIIASIATQTAETFAVVAVVAFVVMYWRTSEGPLTSLFGSVVIAQLVAGARIAHAMRNNPLNYVFMRKYVDRPFSYRVSRFQGEEEAHPVAARLPGFAPVATIRDSEADPEPVFDVYHDPSRLVAASVSRASGSIALISSLDDGRILVTDTRAMPPHERLVMSLAADDSIESVIATHRRAVSARSDVVELASSAHQVVLDSLAVEYDSYATLGPALSPFLDLEPKGRAALRLTARIGLSELAELPTRLGPDRATPKDRVIQSDGHKVSPPVAPAAKQPPTSALPTPALPTSEMTMPVVVAPSVDAPVVDAPVVDAPEIHAPEIHAPEMHPLMVPMVEVPMVEVPMVEAPMVAAPISEPVRVQLAPFADLVTPSISAAPIGTQTEVRVAVDAVAAIVPATVAAVVPEAIVPEPVTVAAVATEVITSEPVVLVAPPPEVGPTPFVTRYPDAPDVERPREPVTKEVPAVVVAVALPPFANNPPPAPATLAEAVVAAPDTVAVLTNGPIDYRAPAAYAESVDASPAGKLGADLAAALGYNDEPVTSRPRLSAVLRANSAAGAGADSALKRSRRKTR